MESVPERLRKLLYNYDMTIVYVNSEIAYREKKIDVLKNSRRNSAQKLMIEMKIEKDRYESYLEELIEQKKQLQENLDIVLNKYQPKYKAIFYYYFIQKKDLTEIAELTKFSYSNVKCIIRKLKNEIINAYEI